MKSDAEMGPTCRGQKTKSNLTHNGRDDTSHGPGQKRHQELRQLLFAVNTRVLSALGWNARQLSECGKETHDSLPKTMPRWLDVRGLAQSSCVVSSCKEQSTGTNKGPEHGYE